MHESKALHGCERFSYFHAIQHIIVFVIGGGCCGGSSSGSMVQNTNWNWLQFWLPHTRAVLYHCQSWSFHWWCPITYEKCLGYKKDSPLDLEKAHIQVTLDIAGTSVHSCSSSCYALLCDPPHIDGTALLWYSAPLSVLSKSPLLMTWHISEMSDTVIKLLFIKSGITSTSSSKILIAVYDRMHEKHCHRYLSSYFLQVTVELCSGGPAPSFMTCNYTLEQAIRGIKLDLYANNTATQLLVVYPFPIFWQLWTRKEKDTKAVKNIALHSPCSGLSGSQ